MKCKCIMYIIDQRKLQLLRTLPHPRHQATRQLPKPEGNPELIVFHIAFNQCLGSGSGSAKISDKIFTQTCCFQNLNPTC